MALDESNPAVRIVKMSVDRITAAMLTGRFSMEDLETIKQVFEEGVRATEDCIARATKETS